MGTDLSIVNAARVSLGKSSEELSENDKGLIGYLMREKHASPFEHCVLSVRVSTSIAVAREWMRHRTQSFNEFSTRYSELTEAHFGIVPLPRKQVGKPGAYSFTPLENQDDQMQIFEIMDDAYNASFEVYKDLLKRGIAKEVARSVLPLATNTIFFATANLRNWFNFLSLRTSEQALFEIRQEAELVEDLIAKLWPVAYQRWVDNGRNQI